MTKKPNPPAVTETRLIGVIPWDANGPGWRNQGVTAYFEDTRADGTIAVRDETINRSDLTEAQQLAWKVGLEVVEVLAEAFGGKLGKYRRAENLELKGERK
jgi:hypothetical protein